MPDRITLFVIYVTVVIGVSRLVYILELKNNAETVLDREQDSAWAVPASVRTRCEMGNMKRNEYVLAAVVLAVGLVAPACGSSGDSTTTVTETVPASTTSATARATTTTSPASATPTASDSADLQSLIPTPASSQRTDGPDSIQENGIHTHFLVSGSPVEVMDAYKAALEGKGWSLTVERSGGGGAGGGATYTGTNGGAYGVFVGGGYGSKADVDSCAWPSKPSNTDCGRNN